jgi:hypothetical protein
MNGKMLAIGSLLLISVSSQADSLRCKQGLASTGDRSVEVLSKCGEPAHKSVVGYAVIGYPSTSHYSNSPRNVEVPQEEWVYMPEGGMQYFLLIEGGIVSRIESKRGN